jgi:hypothetical protein
VLLVRLIPIVVACLHVRVARDEAPSQEPHKGHTQEHGCVRLWDRSSGPGLPGLHNTEKIALRIEFCEHEGLRPRRCTSAPQPFKTDGEQVSERGVVD